eukprot:1414198-Alexandrium_andersonii.AAC.1
MLAVFILQVLGAASLGPFRPTLALLAARKISGYVRLPRYPVEAILLAERLCPGGRPSQRLHALSRT